MTLATQASGDDKADIGSRLKDSALAALLTLVLCIPIIMFLAESDNDGDLQPIFRPIPVIVLMALAFYNDIARQLG